MKAEEIDEILQHHGVKGMKWGVTRDGFAKSTVRVREVLKLLKTRTKENTDKWNKAKIIRKDKAWASKSTKNAISIYNKFTPESKKIAERINTKYENKYGKNFASKMDSKTRKTYAKEFRDEFSKGLARQAETSNLGKSPSGKYKLKIVLDERGLPSWGVETTKSKVKHSAIDAIMVTNMSEIGEDILQHHGVKGMKSGGV